MIISKKYAEKLIREGKAEYLGDCRERGTNWYYSVINRLDKQRTDHVKLYFTERMAISR
jgi:hypothetical protein